MRQQKLWVAALIVALVMTVSACGGGGSPETTPPTPTETTDAVAEAEKRCVALWNRSPGEHRGWLWLMFRGSRYVSVGFDATYGDLCLITALDPDPDIGLATQWIQRGRGFKQIPKVGFEGLFRGSELGPSVTDWNATVSKNGRLTYRAP